MTLLNEPGSRVKLNAAVLGALQTSVAVPQYDRAALTVGIVHVGVGGFHRSHQAAYLDDLMAHGLAHDFAICGVGVLEHDRAMRDALASQDNLYTLVLKHSDGTRTARVIGSITEYLYGPDDPDAVVERMADPRVAIVSFTITAAGYKIDPSTGLFLSQDPDVLHDLGGGVPRTVFSYVCAALERRRARGTAPFTIMSCDNMPGNGDAARTAFTSYAALIDPNLGEWIAREVSFPNSMVDRITPFTTDEDRAALTAETGVVDSCPVVSEPFAQWVLEDHFVGRRPPYEKAGVQIVADAAPYELLKLRMLNSTHQAMAYLGYLAGHRYVHEACTDPFFVGFLSRYMSEEVAPTLPSVEGVDIEAYRRTLLERFANPQVRDTLARLAGRSSSAVPTLVFPIIRDNLAAGRSISLATAVVAAWACFSNGLDEQGSPLLLNDPLGPELAAAADAAEDDPLQFVRRTGLFADLADDERFLVPFARAVETIHRRGAGAYLAELLS